jgi:hypothetical protein
VRTLNLNEVTDPAPLPSSSRGPNSNDSKPKPISLPRHNCRSTVVKLGNSRTTHSPPGRPGPSRIGLSSITIASAIHLSKRLLFDPKLFWTLASLVVVADVALTQLIVHFVPCAKSPPSAASDLSPTIHQIRKLTGKLICIISKFIWTESETILQSPGRLDP